MEPKTETGDLLLVTGTGTNSKAIIAAQKPFHKNVRSSHVAIHLADGTFIHSAKDKGVHIAPISKVLEGASADWRVIRLRDLSARQRQFLSIEANYFLSQSYNIGFGLAGTSSSSFCSELAAKVYNRAGHEILGGKMPSKVFPGDFDLEADKLVDWEDVTEDYRSLIKSIESQPEIYAIGFKMLEYSLLHIRETNARSKRLLKVAESLCDSEESKAEIRKIGKKLDEAKNFNYWDIKPS